MKKVLSVLLTSLVLLPFLWISSYAAEAGVENLSSRTVEYLEDGSYFVIVVEQSAPCARSNKTDGYKNATFYDAGGTAIWAVEVHGYFTYSGTSATADSATATVYRYASDATTLKKSSYVSGASAYAYASVKYLQSTASKTVKLTCDKNGNLS